MLENNGDEGDFTLDGCLLDLLSSVVLTFVGVLLAPQMLIWMDTPSNVLPSSITYFRIYFAGSLGLVMYNIFVGILQSVGDSRHPLIYLICSSCINVVLDIFFIAGLGKGVWVSGPCDSYFPSLQVRSLYDPFDTDKRRVPAAGW